MRMVTDRIATRRELFPGKSMRMPRRAMVSGAVFLALLPASASASRFAGPTLEGTGYFLLLFLLVGYGFLSHLLMLAKVYRFSIAALLHVGIVMLSPFLLHALWTDARQNNSLTDSLWLLWALAGFLIVPILLFPPLLQWWGHLHQRGTPKRAWVLAAMMYVTGALLLAWGATH